MTVPATLVLAADAAMRHAFLRHEELRVYPTDGDRWEAACGDNSARGDTPWSAIKALDDRRAT